MAIWKVNELNKLSTNLDYVQGAKACQQELWS
jgi:hypothetical protein